ncbi:MAG: hypothetical protein OWT28_01000 [Firmicutes bacterium]|nr:hypothetical protein [Bacillota bacterium]
MDATKLQGVAVVAAISVIAWLTAPAVRRNYRHVTKTVGEGLSNTWRQGRRWVEIGREEIADIVADAQLERMRRAIDRELADS